MRDALADVENELMPSRRSKFVVLAGFEFIEIEEVTARVDGAWLFVSCYEDGEKR